jgi:hypothetical protein
MVLFESPVYLLTLYAKAEVKDLTHEQVRVLRKLVEAELK